MTKLIIILRIIRKIQRHFVCMDIISDLKGQNKIELMKIELQAKR